MPARAGLLAGSGLLAAFVFLLYAPALGFTLMGDDYEWVQLAHRARHEPRYLLADLGTFYRPASTWTLCADRALSGTDAGGFHRTNLMLHAAAAVGLALLAARLGLGPVPALAVGALWGLSPCSDEPAISVAIRFEDLLFLAWIGLALAWPGPGERFTRKRLGAIALLIILALFSKETWVVTPGIVAALEIGRRRTSPGRAVRTALVTAIPVAVYLAAYAAAFPSDKGGYYALRGAVLRKPAHLLGAFFGFHGLLPLEFPLQASDALAVLAALAAALLVLRRRSPAGVLGLALLALSYLPTALVPYLPTRYTSIPYAGFVLLAAGALSELLRGATGRIRPAAAIAIGLLVALVLAAGGATVRGDLRDFARVSEAHARLLAESREAVAGLPPERPFLFERLEHAGPLAAIARSPEGLPKIFYPRRGDPYELADIGALLEWTLGREGTRIEPLAAGGGTPAVRDVLVHEEGGFRWLATAPAPVDPVRVRGEGRRVTLLRARRLGAASGDALP